jgi:hypothetical protein
MELDYLYEGTCIDFLTLLPILVAGYLGFAFVVKCNYLLQFPTVHFVLSSDIHSITTNINQLLIGVLPFQFLRVFLTIRRIRTSPDHMNRFHLSAFV